LRFKPLPSFCQPDPEGAMTGREKIEAAFSPDGTSEIPAVFCYDWIYFRDHWPQLTSRPWWTAQDPDVDAQMRMMRDLVGKSGEDWFTLPVFYSKEDRENLFLDVRGGRVFLVHRPTGERRELEEPQVGGWPRSGGVASFRPERPAETFDEIDEGVPLPPVFDEAAFRASRADGLASLMLTEFGTRLYPMNGVASPLWLCYDLWGFEGMMTMVALRADLVKHACERFLARELERVRQAAAVGAAGIWIEDCMTDMVSPGAFATLNVPFLRRIVEEVRARGMKSIYYYCGSPAGRWDHIFDVGADALSLEEGKKGFTIDIDEVVDRVGGRCVVLGNLDAINLLPRAGEEELRREIGRQLAAGRRNRSRFIMSIGSPVTPGTSVERVRRYCEMVHDMGARTS
jgi:hypothetical protein